MNNTVYIIKYLSKEIDDYYGDHPYDIVYCTLNKDDAQKTFDNIKNTKLNDCSNILSKNQNLNSVKDYFEIISNTSDTLDIIFGKYSYEYILSSYELNKNYGWN